MHHHNKRYDQSNSNIRQSQRVKQALSSILSRHVTQNTLRRVQPIVVRNNIVVSKFEMNIKQYKHIMLQICMVFRVWNVMQVATVFFHKYVYNLITVQQDATYSVYYISVGSSTCFGC